MDMVGTVVVCFTVEADGKVFDIKAISGPDLLQQAALTVFANMPNWKPALHLGKPVKSEKKQPIIFTLEEVR